MGSDSVFQYRQDDDPGAVGAGRYWVQTGVDPLRLWRRSEDNTVWDSVGTPSVGGGAGGTEYAEDSVHANGHFGTMVLGVRKDTRASNVGTDGDYAPFQVNADGDIRVDASAVPVPVTDNGGSLTVDGTFWQATQPVSGTVAVSNFPAAQPVTDNGGSLTVDGTVAVSGSVAVTGPLTDAQIRATALPVSVADGADVTQGDVSDAAWSGSGDGTLVAVLKAIWTRLRGGQATMANSLPVAIASDQSAVPVSGTFWQATQPVSGTVTATGGLTDTELRATAVPVSAASLPLPTGASTAAKQPALGTAGTSSTDVLTVQGIAAMTALKVDGSAVTQPVSGTFFQAAQPVTDNGGSLTVDGTVGVSGSVAVTGTLTDAELRATAVPVSGTVTASGPLTDAQLRAAVVPISDGGGSVTVDGTFWQATQPVSGPLTDAQLRATAVPVDSELTTADLDTGAGTDTRAVVGVALAESGGAVLLGTANPLPISDNGGSVTVDGTFWQATQPVSGPLTDAQLRAAVVPVGDGGGSLTVDGTFWQATQPVSGTVTANAGTGPFPVSDNGGSLTVDGPLTDAQLRASVVPVDLTGDNADLDSGAGTDNHEVVSLGVAGAGGHVAITGDATNGLDVDVTRLPSLVAGSAIIGSVKIVDTAGTNQLAVDASGALAIQAGGATGAAVPARAVQMGGTDGTNLRALAVDSTGAQKLAAGTNNIGDVDVLTLPSLVAGSAIIGAVLASGDVDHDAVNTAKVVQVGGHASPVDVPPTAVAATARRVRAHMDRYGAQVVRRRKIRESYTAVFRLAEAVGRLDQTFTHVTNTNKQWATLHHTAGATKELRLTYCAAYITAWSAAGQGVLELRQISAAPVTGNPPITPTAHRRGGTAAEAVCLYLPTTAGTDAGANSPIAHVPIDYGIMAAVPTTNPFAQVQPIILYNAANEDDEMMPAVLPVATLDGWAVMLRTVGTPAVRMTVVMKFTEEIP